MFHGPSTSRAMLPVPGVKVGVPVLSTMSSRRMPVCAIGAETGWPPVPQAATPLVRRSALLTPGAPHAIVVVSSPHVQSPAHAQRPAALSAWLLAPFLDGHDG